MRGTLQTLAAFLLVGLLASLANWQRRVDVEIDLAATPAQVWAVISETSDYRSWNPTLTWMEGPPVVRGPLDFVFIQEDGTDEPLNGTWIEARPGRLAWEVKPGLGRWFDRLFFIRVDLAADGGSKTRIGVVASGVSVLWKEDEFAAQTEPAIARMLKALATRLDTQIR
ncbi:SRPBCC family protein [Lacibacterium aquatile]|uniref:SRPBCC family protein n=1 Tax=Lacibacterium aquatile TaxID=1168082 RepID=A0ABW5DP26_9PROT